MRAASEEKIELKHANTDASFGRCLVDGDTAAASGGSRARRKAFGLSLAVEATALGLLIVVPLITSVAQPRLSRVTPPMIVDLVGWRAHNTIQNSKPLPVRPHISLPVWNFSPQPPGRVVNSHETAESGDGVPPGSSGDMIPGVIEIVDLHVTPPKLPPPPNVHQNATVKGPVKVSGDVEQAQLISQIEPRYPPLALQIKKEGTVLLHAIISRDGRITALEVVSGPPLLVQAAVDAVRQWRYRPTLLNGDPVEVETTITIMFRLQP